MPGYRPIWCHSPAHDWRGQGMKGTLPIALLVAAVTLLGAAAAAAEEPAAPTRAEYVSQVEPICQANTEADKRILKNVQQNVRQGNSNRRAGSSSTSPPPSALQSAK